MHLNYEIVSLNPNSHTTMPLVMWL